ncbi:hypothetical protein BT67DRAFT_35078 [Trichocladium antarcticum]|uniref:Uncharacterized protein n=1 Tax=Trichocladium antarcticum TaxID=1450529 RepID=A0AAN6UJ19_9PEZI|nr:hypothetical protein BT67DRAFT_35078 [Trichocladium antarcticum]
MPPNVAMGHGARKGRGSMTVTEGRRMFEQLSGDDDPFKVPAITRSASTHDIQLPLVLQSPELGHTASDGGLAVLAFDKSPTPESDRDCLKPLTHGAQDGLSLRHIGNTLAPRKSYSVADLRKIFGDASPRNAKKSGTSASEPSTPKPAYHMKIEVSAEFAAKFAKTQQQRHSEPDPQSGDRNKCDAGIAPLQPTSLGSCRCTTKCHNAPFRAGDQENLGPVTRDELSQSIRHRPGQLTRLIETPHRPSQIRTPDSNSSTTHPLLLARTISVKAYTIRSTSGDSLRNEEPTIKATNTSINELHEPSTGTQGCTMARKASPEPSVPPPLKHWKDCKTTSPLKSRPSLPIIISATVSTSTDRSRLRGLSSRTSVTARRSSIHLSRRKPIQISSFDPFDDGPMDAPSHDYRATRPKTREAQIRDRIRLFEQVNHPGGAASDNSKSPAESTASSSDSGRRTDWKTASGWELRRVVQALRVRTFSGQKKNKYSIAKPRTGDFEAENSKPRFPKHKRNNFVNLDGAGVADHPSPPLEREFTLSIRATIRKLSRGERRCSAATFKPQLKSSASTELMGKATTMKPRPFRSIRTRSGRILPFHKSHGALDTKSKWDPLSKKPDTSPDLPQAPRAIPQPTTAHQALPPPNRAQRHASPFRGKLAGSTVKKSGALPVLSPAPAHAQKAATHRRAQTQTQPQTHTQTSAPAPSLTWGRRAAAAAMDLGRTLKLKARKASSSSSSVRRGSLDVGGGGEEGGSGGGSGKIGGGADVGGRGRGVTRHHDE